MGTADRNAHQIHGKVVYFGASGSGSSANLAFIQRKLKREHRGELKRLATRDGVAAYETLPVQLGSVRGYTTAIQISSVPGAAEAVALRRQILEAVDGIVFVADLRPERHDATVAALAELRQHLAAQKRKLEHVPLVVQYNHRDQADENAVDSLHRRLGLRSVSCFEAVAKDGTGVLQTLTTLSKLVVTELRKVLDESSMRDQAPPVPAAAARRPAPAPVATPRRAPASAEITASVEDGAEKGFVIESAGPVDGSGNELRIPVCLVDEATGRRVEIAVRIAIDAP